MTQQANNPPYRDLPTTSLYLQDSLGGENLWTAWESCRTGPFSFRFDDRLVLIRYATIEEVELARKIRAEGGRVIYLIDDDLQAIVDESQLPEDYRGRINEFVSGAWQILKELIDEVVVSSESLAEKMRQDGFDAVTQLDPSWTIPPGKIPGPADHDRGAPLEIAWLCSRSHVADLESISVELTEFLSHHRDVKLTVIFGKNQPGWLKSLDQVENLKPLAWHDYRNWIQSRQFDVALYPLENTKVNQCRSINKFLEHAVVGAASIISSNAPFANRLEAGDCLFAEPGEWRDGLEMLLADRSRVWDMANQARRHARILSDEARTRQVGFWKKRLPVIAVDKHAPRVRV